MTQNEFDSLPQIATSIRNRLDIERKPPFELHKGKQRAEALRALQAYSLQNKLINDEINDRWDKLA